MGGRRFQRRLVPRQPVAHLGLPLDLNQQLRELVPSDQQGQPQPPRLSVVVGVADRGETELGTAERLGAPRVGVPATNGEPRSHTHVPGRITLRWSFIETDFRLWLVWSVLAGLKVHG